MTVGTGPAYSARHLLPSLSPAPGPARRRGPRAGGQPDPGRAVARTNRNAGDRDSGGSEVAFGSAWLTVTHADRDSCGPAADSEPATELATKSVSATVPPPGPPGAASVPLSQ